MPEVQSSAGSVFSERAMPRAKKAALRSSSTEWHLMPLQANAASRNGVDREPGLTTRCVTPRRSRAVANSRACSESKLDGPPLPAGAKGRNSGLPRLMRCASVIAAKEL